MTFQATYQISGMTCGHCVSAVTAELKTLPGVRKVDVDLAGGSATVDSEAELALDDVRKAVDEAGYALAGVHA